MVASYNRMTSVNGTHKKKLELADQNYFIPISDIDKAYFNPKDRDLPTKSYIKKLAASIAEMGQVQPICVVDLLNGRYGVSDGHCRLSACILLKRTKIKAAILDEDQAVLFMHLNTFVKPHSANETLAAYAANSNTVSNNRKTSYSNMEEMIGRKVFMKVVDAGRTYNTFKQACDLARYCHKGDDPKFVTKTLNWLIDNRMTASARRWKVAKQSPVDLMWAIWKNEKLVY